MSLRLKLLLALTLLCVAGLGLALVAAQHAVESAAREKIRSDLQVAVDRQIPLQIEALQRMSDVAMQGTFLNLQLVQALTEANQSDEALGLGTGGTDDQGLESAHAVFLSADLPLLREVGTSAGAGMIALANAQGRLIFNSAHPDDFGGSLSDSALVQAALRGEARWTLWSAERERALPTRLLPAGRNDELFLLLARPIVRGQVLGVVILGRQARPALIDHVQALSGSEVAVETTEGTVLSTLSGREPPSSVDFDPAMSQLRLGETTYLAQGAPLRASGGEVIGTIYLLRDLRRELSPILTRFRQSLFPAALAVLTAAVLISLVLARRMSDPLVRLEAAARRVQQGDLTVEVGAKGTDEVGRVSAAFDEMVRGLRQREEIKSLFKRYLNPQVVDELIRHPEKAALGGERRVLTVLFADLVGFTEASENLSPEALLATLNSYYEEAAQVLARHGATLDKFIGDAIMCFYNAPLPQEDHAARACLTALGLLELVDRLRPAFSTRGFPALDCRIGVNTGACVVGNVGSKEAHDYTVIGDAVNLASRLEGAAKMYGTRTLVTAETLASVQGLVRTRELDLLRVKGRGAPVRVFELVGPIDAPSPPHLASFAEGLALYRAARFLEARKCFDQAPGDNPSRAFSARCLQYEKIPPPESWGGIFTLDSK